MLELLAEGEHTAGAIGSVVQREFGISQPAVSQHLRVIREQRLDALGTELARGKRRPG